MRHTVTVTSSGLSSAARSFSAMRVSCSLICAPPSAALLIGLLPSAISSRLAAAAGSLVVAVWPVEPTTQRWQRQQAADVVRAPLSSSCMRAPDA